MNTTQRGAVAAVLARVAGMRLDPASESRLDRCVEISAADASLSIEEFLEQLVIDDAAVQELLDRVTVQETWFFRDPAHFDAAAAILTTAAAPVTIWSAGCANGQEAYSLAMLLDELGIDGEVVATDISTRAIARTRSGRYTERELRGLSQERTTRHLLQDKDRWHVRAELRRRVRPLHHNLVRDGCPVTPRSCLVVFCRNVLIYLSANDVQIAARGIELALSTDGYLFVGPSEHMHQDAHGLRAMRLGATFGYKSATPSAGSSSDANAKRRVTPAAPRARHARAPRPAAASGRPDASAGLDTTTSLDRGGAMATGRLAMRHGDVKGAVAWFRKAAYLDADDAVAHLELGMALDADGDGRAARRSYTAARAALARSAPADVEGYDPAELSRLIDSRLVEETP